MSEAQGGAGVWSRRPFAPRGRHLLVYDVLATLLAIVGAFALRFDARDVLGSAAPYLPIALLPVVVQPSVNLAFGLYRRAWRYAGLHEVFGITGAVFSATVLNGLIFVIAADFGVAGTDGFPRSFWGIEALLALVLIGGGRLTLRWFLELDGRAAGPDRTARRVLVYGAGEAGVSVARMSDRDPRQRIRVVGFLDDDPARRDLLTLGRRVFGPIDELASVAHRTGAEELIVAMPSAPGVTVRRAVEEATRLGLAVRVVPSATERLPGPVPRDATRPVLVEDLLRREPMAVDVEALAGYINGKIILVTGAGGSIGSELSRQVQSLGPRALIAVDNNEYALWRIDRELRTRTHAQATEVHARLVDVRSRHAVESLIASLQPDVVFHAAALKHVPICETHPSEAVLTNVVGTRNVLASAELHGVERLVLISTDKAVLPTSVMGASKRVAELLVSAAAHRSGRPYVSVRFGNVLGSSGSVVPIFEEQIAQGIPLTITHPDATRYFMTISEAVTLILQAASTPEIGETYVLDMGEPIRIQDLARDIARMAGVDPDRLEIVYTGLRPGERLHETPLEDEMVTTQAHDRIWKTVPRPTDPMIDGWIDDLVSAARTHDDVGVRETLARMGVLNARETEPSLTA